jgi:F-type H+-transporting ATPase subunit gamma
MPNLKDIRSRIKSIKNTQKITQAMRMVAAAKVKKAENSLKASRPYTDLLTNMMSQVFPLLTGNMDELRESRFYEALCPHHAKRVGLFVVSADRGLCGTYNASIIKRLTELVKQYEKRHQSVRLYLVGNKAIRHVNKYHPDVQVLNTAYGLNVPVEYIHASQAGDVLLDAFLENRIDQIDVLYTQFINMVTYDATHRTLLPLDISAYEAKPTALVQPSKERTTTKEIASELEFEPGAVELVEEIIPMYVKRQLYSALLESSTSELAARMAAMDNASKNAKDLIYNLTLVYNKARQAAITQELMEIVGGAEALK